MFRTWAENDNQGDAHGNRHKGGAGNSNALSDLFRLQHKLFTPIAVDVPSQAPDNPGQYLFEAFRRKIRCRN